MNTPQVRTFLAQGGVVNRFTKLTASARRWVRDEYERGALWRMNDGFPNGRWMYSATEFAFDR